MTSQTLHGIPAALLEAAKAEQISMISSKVKERKQKMIDSIKQSVIKYNPYFQNTFAFDIKESAMQQIIHNITNVLSRWDGGKGYRRVITTDTQAKHKVRNYWNRTKPKPLGDYLFNCVIGNLFQYVMDGFDSNLPEKDKLLFFIYIFEKLLNEKIQFPRSMSRPLIFQVCLKYRNNKFQKFCTKFVDTFGSMTYGWNKTFLKALPEGYIRQIENRFNLFVPTAIKMLCVKYCRYYDVIESDYEWDNTIKVTRSIRDPNGRARSVYIRNTNRTKESHGRFLTVLENIKLGLEYYPKTRMFIQQQLDFTKFIQEELKVDQKDVIKHNVSSNESRNDNVIGCSQNVYNNVTEQSMLCNCYFNNSNIGTTMLSNGYQPYNYNLPQNVMFPNQFAFNPYNNYNQVQSPWIGGGYNGLHGATDTVQNIRYDPFSMYQYY